MIIENPEKDTHTHVCDRCGAYEEHLPKKCNCHYVRLNKSTKYWEEIDFTKPVDTTEYKGWACSRCGWNTSMIDNVDNEVKGEPK